MSSPALLAAGRVRRTATHLADGRELIYFDDDPAIVAGESPVRVTEDRRDLPPAAGGSQLRFDPLTGDWIAVASHRNTRTFLPPASECPLCPTRPGQLPSEVPSDEYDVVVFENRFPSLSLRAPGEPGSVDGEPLFAHRPGLGSCEVVCFTSQHSTAFAQLEPPRVRTVIEAWADRTAELSQLPGIEQVFCFENRGQEIGVTLHHPHGQIYAYPYLTPRTEALVRQATAHHAATGSLLQRDILQAEQRAGSRVVLQGEHWTAYVPSAARWPVEVHLAPHRDVPDIAALDDAERDELSHVYLELLRRADRYFDGVPALPYISAWHQAPTGPARAVTRLYLQLFSVLRAPGKLKYLAGSESAMGAWINDVVPESIAARLREVAS